MAFIGIDLGTTNSLVANKKPKRETKVLKIKGNKETALEDETHLYLPSAVSYLAGNFLVGWEVMDNPEQEDRIFSIKRLMGRGFDDKDPQDGSLIRDKLKNSWGYNIRKPPKGTGEDIEVKIGDSWYLPQIVSSLILKRIISIAENNLNESIDGVVITVPAYFNDKQKWATREAARLAGIHVQMLLDEPTAAAIAYGMETIGEEPRSVIVYDLGGGTFDVSLLDIAGTNFKVDAIDGNNWLGGDDFDVEIVEFILNILGSDADKIKEDPVKKGILKQRAKELKETLSTSMEATINIADLVSDSNRYDISIQRNEFEQMINSYIGETINLVDSVLKRKSLTVEDIDKVLLVGGSTKIPLVRRCLAQKFGEDIIVTDINPMLAVTMGAAIKSSWLLDKWECPECNEINEQKNDQCFSCEHLKPETINSTERPYGLRAYDSKKQKYIFDVLIPENINYPLIESKRRLFPLQNSNARILKIPYYAGEKSQSKSYFDDIEKNIHLGTLWAILPKGLSSSEKVDMKFNLDNNGILDLGSISLTIKGKPIEKVSIARSGEDENIMEEIEKLLDNIAQSVSDYTKKSKLTDEVYSIFDGLIGSDSGYNNDLIEKQAERIRALIHDEKNGGGSIIDNAKNSIRFSYYIEREYEWLLIRDEERIQEIHNQREELENVLEQDDIDEWQIERLTMKLWSLSSEPSIILLREIEISVDIAEGKNLKYDGLITGPGTEDREKTFLKPKSKEDRIADAKTLNTAKTKIVTLLKQNKNTEARDEYSKIYDLLVYYWAEYLNTTRFRGN